MLVPLVLLAALAGSAAAGGPVTISLASDRSTMEMGMAKSSSDSSSNTNSLYYYVPWEIGTPPQKLHLLLDTGSSRTVVFGSDCDKSMCNTSFPKYDGGRSSTFADGKRTEKLSYGGGTSEFAGTWDADTVSFGGQRLTNLSFVNVHTSNYNGRPLSFGSGIAGLSRSRPTDPEMSITQLMANGSDNPRFGVYLDRRDGEDRTMHSGLTLNGIDESKIARPVSYAPVAQPPSKLPGWWVAVGGVRIGDTNLKLSGKHVALIDSGTPGIRVPPDVAKAFYAKVKGATVNMNGVNLFPCAEAERMRLSITVAGVEVPVFWKDLSRPVDKKGRLCRGEVGTREQEAVEGNVTEPTQWVLGATFMKNVYSAFQYEPLAVGFAPLKPEFNVQSGANRVTASVGLVLLAAAVALV